MTSLNYVIVIVRNAAPSGSDVVALMECAC